MNDTQSGNDFFCIQESGIGILVNKDGTSENGFFAYFIYSVYLYLKENNLSNLMSPILFQQNSLVTRYSDCWRSGCKRVAIMKRRSDSSNS